MYVRCPLSQEATEQFMANASLESRLGQLTARDLTPGGIHQPPAPCIHRKHNTPIITGHQGPEVTQHRSQLGFPKLLLIQTFYLNPCFLNRMPTFTADALFYYFYKGQDVVLRSWDTP